MSKITIDDLARECGLSTATVSRVINDNPPYSAKAAEKVNAASHRLGYIPSLMARSMASGRSRNAGLIVPQQGNPYFTTLIRHLETELSAADIFLNITYTHSDFEVEKLNIRRILSWNPGALIISDGHRDGFESGFYRNLAKTVPLVFISGQDRGPDAPFIFAGADIGLGVRKALDFLSFQKHSRVSLIVGDYEGSNSYKRMMFKKHGEEKGMSCSELLLNYYNDARCLEELQSKLPGLLSSENAPSALIAGNEIIALSVLRLCNSSGIRIPEDLSLITFDNTVFSQISVPSISCIDLRMGDVSRRVAEELKAVILEGKDEPRRSTLETELIIRESTRTYRQE